MRLTQTIHQFIVLGIIWISENCFCEKDFNTCTFFYWKTKWSSAVQTCKRSNKELLCYKSRKEIDDITEAFRLSAYSDAALHIWLSSKNCSSQSFVPCLSLHVKKKGSSIWHYFQENCFQEFPFVCCIKDTDQTSTTVQTTFSNVPEFTISTYRTSTSTGVPIFTSSIPPKFCKKTWNRGIFWPDTNAGETARLPCPGNSTGNAHWHCENVGNGKWSKIGPDLKGCRSFNIINLKEKFNTSSIADIMSFLEDTFEDEKEMFSEDLADLISLMTALPERLLAATLSQSSSVRWITTQTIMNRSTTLFDHMIGLSTSWNDMEEKKRSVVGTDLLSTIDGMSLLLADAMVENVQEQSIIKKNIALQVLRNKYGEAVQLPQWSSVSQFGQHGNVLLAKGYDSQIDPEKGNISVVFTLYADLTRILTVQQSQNNSNQTGILNSAVVSAMVSQNRQPAKLNSKVTILVEHLVSQPNDTACVFWNMQLNQWDTQGCHLGGSNDSHSVCVCNHLTNFAVLMDYKGLLDDIDQTVFDYITLIGCSLSIISLSLCVIVFSCYSYHSNHTWGLRYIIHRNLCLTLLIGNFVLILGLDETSNPSLCAVVAGALHYFFLSAFSWMFLEGVHIYLLLVVVFASRRSHWEKYYVFGYGFPLIIVTITAISRPTFYGTKDVCWLSVEKGTIWAFMGPVACILLMNFAALILAQYKASKISMKDDNVAVIKRWLRVTFILFPVLGITWIFGFLHVGEHFEVAGYIFAIFNSLQGFCIFVCHCLMDKKARNLVLASFKKKTASVNTGSTNVQKKQKTTGEADVVILNPIQNGTQNKALPLSFRDTLRRHWNGWHMPWSFCFDMPISESGSYDIQRENTSAAQRPVIVHWNSIRDKAA